MQSRRDQVDTTIVAEFHGDFGQLAVLRKLCQPIGTSVNASQLTVQVGRSLTSAEQYGLLQKQRSAAEVA